MNVSFILALGLAIGEIGQRRWRSVDIKQYDSVLLKDGREGCAVEVFDDEILVDVGSSSKDWETISVKRIDVEKVL